MARTMDRLTTEIAGIVGEGRKNGLPADDVAIEIMRHLKRESRRYKWVKPKRGIGVLTQADILRGL